MRRNWLLGFGLLVAATMLTGCTNNAADENALLTEENQSLREQLADRNGALESAHLELRDRDSEIARLQQDLTAAPPPSEASSDTFHDPFGGIEGVSGSVGQREIVATLEGDHFFDAGKITLKPAAQRSLDRIAGIINASYSGMPIRIAGHTDTDPIRKSGYKSNYHLGFERAYAVREYLISRGVSRRLMYLASYGPDRAMSSKNESRRVEIVVAQVR